jgi:hypothetical protein
MAGDERWPSWTAMADWCLRIAIARPAGRNGDPSLQYDIYLSTPVSGSEAWQRRCALTETADSETYPRVSPDGTKVAFISERDSEDDLDLWWMPVPAPRSQADSAWRPSAEAGVVVGAVRRHRWQAVARQSHHARARQRSVSIVGAGQSRIAFYAVREGIGSVWVATAEPPRPEPTEDPLPRAKPAAQPQLVRARRRAGVVAGRQDAARVRLAGSAAGL